MGKYKKSLYSYNLVEKRQLPEYAVSRFIR